MPVRAEPADPLEHPSRRASGALRMRRGCAPANRPSLVVTPNSGRIQGLRQPDQIQRRRLDHAAARAVDVGLRHFWILSAATRPGRRTHRKAYQQFITRRERVWRRCLTAVRPGPRSVRHDPAHRHRRRARRARPAAPSREGAPAGPAGRPQAALDPRQGARLAGLFRDAEPRARAQARHRLRGGALSQHRRMLGQAPRDLHDHGGDLHPRLRLLQRAHRPAGSARRERARPRRRRRRQARLWPMSW